MTGLGAITGAAFVGRKILEKNIQKKDEKRKEEEEIFLDDTNFYCASFCYGYFTSKV